ncbi:MAG TPA: hypothetical protein VFO65_13915, partial [Acidimicrobiales bacterium]|nr:hypothetical protein [Acidimicrobiales bacterium]
MADLDGVVEAMERIAAGFDPAVVSSGEAGSVALRAATVEKLAATVKALAAARAADVAVGPGSSERDVAERLARRSGVSLGAARAAIETGRRLCHQPELAAAARRGEVSAVQAAAIARAVAANPGAEGRLVALAAASSVTDLITECDR